MEETSSERAKRYRGHAAEIRAVAVDIKHPESRAALLRLAATYERLAERLESEGDVSIDLENEDR